MSMPAEEGYVAPGVAVPMVVTEGECVNGNVNFMLAQCAGNKECVYMWNPQCAKWHLVDASHQVDMESVVKQLSVPVVDSA